MERPCLMARNRSEREKNMLPYPQNNQCKRKNVETTSNLQAPHMNGSDDSCSTFHHQKFQLKRFRNQRQQSEGERVDSRSESEESSESSECEIQSTRPPIFSDPKGKGI